MPDWAEILAETKSRGSIYDTVRREHLARLRQVTQRNVIVYYSAWLQKPELAQQGYSGFSLDDSDKGGFMTAVHKLDRTKGLDLVLHTPGGEMAATESLVDYLRSLFGNDIRAIVPQLAMSAGTMIALSCRQILMGAHSSLGPIDPQIAGLPAHAIIEEFNSAADQIRKDPATIPLWQPIIAKYSPTLVGECQKAIDWSGKIVREWLQTGMFAGDPNAKEKADQIVNELGDHALTLSHARHISLKRAKDLGVVVDAIEDNDELQDAILSVHHACIQTLTATHATKIIENHEGTAFIPIIQTQTR